MKQLMIMLLAVVVLSCSSDDTPIEPPNQFLNTSWRSFDPIMAILYGPGSTKTIEFISETECIEVQFRTGTLFNSVSETGTYTYDGDNISWTVGNNTINATRRGSFLETTIVINGNPILYQRIAD